MPWRSAARDLLILGLALAAWAADARLRGGGGALALSVAVATGTLTALVGYLAHEWGHLAGARLAGAAVALPNRVGSVFLFLFDTTRNGRREFLWMSSGGFAASAAVLALLVWLLPLGALSGQVALGLALLGTLATVVLELPPYWRVARGAPLPRKGPAFI